MKARTFTTLMVSGLALSLLATGCKTKDKSVTKLPEPAPTPVAADTNPIYNPTPSPTNTDLPIWDPTNFIPVRAAFAAETVHFDFDSPVVRQSEMIHVQTVATALRSENTAMLMVEGHADERGTEEYNRSLGERRALALREQLAKLNIDPMRIRTLTFGEDQPVDPGHNETAWQKNRRGEFVLLRPKM